MTYYSFDTDRYRIDNFRSMSHLMRILQRSTQYCVPWIFKPLHAKCDSLPSLRTV